MPNVPARFLRTSTPPVCARRARKAGEAKILVILGFIWSLPYWMTGDWRIE
jgi:hypothetical protein